ncbi:uncharacterized protein LOC134532069 isoform X1 [Bacillus rossius redtenbacheri]|uniref:uncharacterized protein LOC134532069 isoform X1 n=1 Tax=Bacillus rossius redtenbacheri TaxID=93214 RepID=UPI002FDDA8F8
MRMTRLDEDCDDGSFGEDLLERLEPGDLERLRECFLGTAPADPHGDDGQSGRPLSRQEFLHAIDSVIGSSAYSLPASRLFTALDGGRGEIRWGQFLDHVLERVGQQAGGAARCQPLAKVALLDPPHCKKEAIAAVVPIATESSFCYAVISKFGRTGIYNGQLQLLDSYQVPLRADGGDGRSRARHAWVTGAAHLPDAACLVVACSDRSLRSYDCSGLSHAALCHVGGLPGVPLCLEYCRGRPSLLFVGDERGDVTLMRFHQPRASLFRKKHPDKLDRYYWQELHSQGDWVTVSVDRKVHDDEVWRIAYCPDNETVVSCSRDPAASLVVRHVAGRKLPYIFRVARGVRCFHLERGLQLLATGSGDGVVRLWNPVVTRRPSVALHGHGDSVEDVLVLSEAHLVVSCAADGVVKVWDPADQCCLQTLPLDFPSLQAGERGALGLCPAPRRCLLVACCQHLAVLRQVGPCGGTPPLLPPPSRQHRAAVPSPWRAAEDRVASTPDGTPRASLSASGEPSGREEAPCPLPGPASSLQGLYARRAMHEQRQQAAQYLVEQCAPHLALQLWDLEEVRVPRAPPSALPPGPASRRSSRSSGKARK